MRAIDADVLKRHIDKLPALPDGNFAGNHSALKALINMQPTIEPSTNNSEIPNSSDTISRKAAITAIDNCECDGEDSCGQPWIYKENAVEAIEMVEPLPSAEPEPKCGTWKCSYDLYETAICSCCGYDTNEPWDWTREHFMFCPNCGARMER